jgi:hypothetical protein
MCMNKSFLNLSSEGIAWGISICRVCILSSRNVVVFHTRYDRCSITMMSVSYIGNIR